jgi:hypothetical protein
MTGRFGNRKSGRGGRGGGRGGSTQTKTKKAVEVLDIEENVGAHGWTKVARKRVCNRRTKLQATGVGLHPTGAGLQQTGVGLQPNGVGIHPSAEGLHPTAKGFQPTDVRKRRASTGGHTGPRKTTRSKKERNVEKR